MAYFGQLRTYFDAHGLTMPVVFPRWSATVIEGKIGKVLEYRGRGKEDSRRSSVSMLPVMWASRTRSWPATC